MRKLTLNRRAATLSLILLIATTFLFSGSGKLKVNGGATAVGGSTIQTDIWGPYGTRSVTFQDTAATAHQLQKNGMHLVRIALNGGAAHMGGLKFNYGSNRFALFGVSAVGQADYDLDYQVPGSSIPAASWTTFGTAPASWTLTFSETSWGGPSIDNYLGIFVTVTAGGALAVLTNIAVVNFDAGEAIPTAIQAYTAHASIPSAVYFPGEPGLQGGANAQDETLTFPPPITPAPSVKAANGIIMAYTTAAAGATSMIVYYRLTSAAKGHP